MEETKEKKRRKKVILLWAVGILLAGALGIFFLTQPKAGTEKAQEPAADPTQEQQTVAQGGGPSESADPAKEEGVQPTPTLGGQSQVQTGGTDHSGTPDSTEGGGSAAAHQHTWVDHTTRVWVSKMVTVVDQPAKTVSGGQLYTEQPDGTWLSNGETYWFENGFTLDDLKAIIKDKMKNEGYIGGYVNRTKTIPAVTHQEDQGYYEQRVDYQYCSGCGQRR